ncbi:MAG: threonine/serine exporter family protein [Clostridia bacterium]|nr:threonine/serine exporter family protein [Clostridia bacterium]MBQ3870865.1 threonine/serine exporter family protein [Clostridia bacterium]
MDILSILVNVAVSFLSTFGYCIIFNIPKRQLVFCGLLGIVSWMIYYTMTYFSLSEVLATFAATCAIVLLSRVLSKLRKCPVTIFIIPGIIPIIPGSLLYYTAYNFFTGDMDACGRYGFLTIKIIFAIVFAIIVVFAIPMKRKKKSKT